MLNDTFDSINNIIQSEEQLIQFNDYLNDISLDQYVCSQSELDNVFKKTVTVDLPLELKTVLKDQSTRYSIGVFTDIKRIWLIKGHILYLWNYETNDMFKYQAREQVIYKVELLKPKPGVFDKSIEFIFAIVTSNQTILYGISSYLVKFELSKDKVYKANTSSIIIKSINVSHNGRIFVVGGDGHIYELEYPAQGSTCQLKCHTEESFSFLSYFIKAAPVAKIKLITVDKDNKAIYALTENNDIKIIRLDDGMGTFNLSEQIENINDQVNSYLTQKIQEYQTEPVPASILSTIGSILTPQTFEIISIYALPSNTISFCAVTSHGCRLYFTPALSHVRLPPYLNNQSLAIKFNQSLSSSDYRDGIFTGIVNENSSSPSQLWVTGYQQFYDSSIQELSSTIKLNYSLIAFGIIPKSKYFYEPIYSSIDSSDSLCLALDKERVNFYERQRPINILHRYLEELNNFNDLKKNIDHFNSQYGIENSISLLLCILSTNQSIIDKQKDIIPYLIQTEDQLHQGSIIFYTHIMKQLWIMDVLEFNETSIAKITLLDHSRAQLEQFYGLLKTIKGYNLYLSTINNVQLLIEKTVQIIAFIIFLMENQVEFENTYGTTVFSELVGTDNGLAILKSLVDKTIVIHASLNKRWVNEFLKSRCPNLFGDNKQLELYEGDEYLSRAKLIEDQQQQFKFLDQSVQYYLASFDLLSYEKRNEICETYQHLEYYHGYIILSLEIAKQDSSNNLSINSSSSSNDNHGYSMLISLLNYIKQSELKLSTVLQWILTKSQEKSLHQIIYTWLIEHQAINLIFNMDLPYLLDFLENEYNDKRIGLDWLWKYYDMHHDDSNAATYLKQLATKIPNIPLNSRINYVQLARQRQPIAELEIAYDAAIIQQEIAKRIKTINNGNNSDDDKVINSWLLDMDKLLTQFAIRYEFWGQVILLMELIARSDIPLLYKAWTLLLKQQSNLDELKSMVSSLGKQLYPSDVTFPVYLIVTILESHCFNHHYHKENQPLEVGFIVNILNDIHIPKTILVDAYSTLLDNKVSPWQTEDHIHYLEQQYDYLKNSSL